MTPASSAAESNSTTLDLSLDHPTLNQTDLQGLHEAKTYKVKFENSLGGNEALEVEKTMHIPKHYSCHDTENCQPKLNAIRERKLQLEQNLRDKFELVTINVKTTILSGQ